MSACLLGNYEAGKQAASSAAQHSSSRQADEQATTSQVGNKKVGVGLFSGTEERRRHVKGMKRAPERAWFHGPGDDRARAGHGDGRDRLAPRPLGFGSQHAARPSSSASPTDSPGPRPPWSRRRVARWGGPSQRRQGLGGGPGRCRQYQLACPLGRAHADEVFRRSSAAGVGGLVDARRHPADGRTGGRAVARGDEMDGVGVAIATGAEAS